MREFWDDKARENAMYYVSSYRAYDGQDPEEFWKWGRILAERFLEESEIPITGRESMLEIGCGPGRMTAYFAERFRHVHGLDVSAEMVALAGEKLSAHDNVTVTVGSGVDLAEFEDAAFDFVFSYIVFQHIPEARIVLDYVREAGRVLRTGGHFYFQVNNTRRGLRERLRPGRLRVFAQRVLGGDNSPAQAGPEGPRGLDNPAWVGSRVSVKQIEKTLRQSNMQILSLRGEQTQYLWVCAAKR